MLSPYDHIDGAVMAVGAAIIGIPIMIGGAAMLRIGIRRWRKR